MSKIPNDELLIRIDERVSEILRRLDSVDANYCNIEKRVAVLEGWRWYIMGFSAAFSIAVSYIIKKILG